VLLFDPPRRAPHPQVLINNSVAHQEEQQFLSQEDKAQILCKDADAHKKQQESLSLDEKVQI
jgi:hypothetical protein